MKPTVKKLLIDAESLSPKQRRRLADQLCQRQPLFDDPEIDAEWSDEIKRRVDEVKSGKVKLVSWEEIEKSFKRIRAEVVRAKNSSSRSN